MKIEKKNKKIIGIFIPSFEKGGVERNVLYLTDILISQGFCVELFYTRANQEFFKNLNRNVRKIKFENRFKFPFLHPRLIDSINIFSSLLRYLQNNKINLIISFQNHIISILLAKFLKIQIIVRIANSPDSIKYSQSYISKISHFLKRFIYKYADVIIANSQDTAKYYEKYIGKKVKTIYNPIDIQRVKLLAKEAVNHEWFIKKEKPIVIGVGRLTKQKDFETLIKAFALVKKEIDARLVILGEGEERAKLEKLVKKLGLQNSVWMPGFVNNPYKYIAKADVFVLSSLYEGLPNVLIEAIAVGTPVISTDCLSGPREILLDGKGGDLVNVGDYYSLAKSIIKYLKNPQYAKQKWQIAFNHLNRFSFENIKHKWIELLNTIS